MENVQPKTLTSDSGTMNFQAFRDRLHALKLLQRDYVRTEMDFHRKFFGLDMEYQERRQNIYERRKDVINGAGDLTDDVPNDIVSGVSKALDKMQLNEELVENMDDAKGIPNFWLQAMKNCTHSDDFIHDCDEEALKYLRDIKIDLFNEPELSFTLEFEFGSNPFFGNTQLTKQYFLDCDTDEEFCGFSIIKANGCTIDWKEGMDLVEKEPESFFKFFSPPELFTKNASDDGFTIESSVLYELQQDFEAGLFIKERLIPNAILYYLNEVDDTNEYFEASGDTEETVISETCL